MSTTPLTEIQRKTLFSEIHKTANDLGVDPEAYRKKIMLECCGVEHLADVSRTDGFDRLMVRALQDRGEYGLACRFMVGSAHRLRHLCVEAAETVCALTRYRGSAYEYIAGVMIQAGYLPKKASRAVFADRLVSDSGWGDLTEGEMRRLLTMLRCHLRRIRSRSSLVREADLA